MLYQVSAILDLLTHLVVFGVALASLSLVRDARNRLKDSKEWKDG